MAEEKNTGKFFKSSEELVSMFLGLVMVAVIAGLVINFFQKRKGNVELPGVSVNQDFQTEKEAENNIYEVITGDSLWKIAEVNYGDGNKWVEIAKVNNLKTPGVILKGQKLILPKTDIVKVEENREILEDTEYVVVKGDNLWKICVQAYSDGFMWTKVWQRNKTVLRDPDKLEIGMKLILPKGI
ncbi:MAG: LysM peptidoglycan-binding domain-containing protein [Candidatus Shapirobacteria bacterium]